MNSEMSTEVYSGPCEVQASRACTGWATALVMDPNAMLPGSTLPTDKVPTCEPCQEDRSWLFLANAADANHWSRR